MPTEVLSRPQGQTLETVNGKIYMSPARDIVHAMPEYISRALMICSDSEEEKILNYYEKGGTEEELGQFALALSRFVKRSNDPENIEDSHPNEAAQEAGLWEFPDRVYEVFGIAFFEVVMGSFWSGNQEIASGHMRFVEEDGLPTRPPKSGFTNWLRRTTIKLLNYLP